MLPIHDYASGCYFVYVCLHVFAGVKVRQTRSLRAFKQHCIIN